MVDKPCMAYEIMAQRRRQTGSQVDSSFVWPWHIETSTQYKQEQPQEKSKVAHL